MPGTIRDAKGALRLEVRSRLRQMSAEQCLAASAHARALLKAQQIWRTSHTVLLFAPLPEELDVWPLAQEALAAGKTVLLPRFSALAESYEVCAIHDPKRDLQPGQFGIREPIKQCPQVALNRLDFLLVPGLAFDLHGRRIGRGKGFYDQLLPAVRGVTCGVAFDEQIVPAIPVEPHDISVNRILTPTRWLEL